MSTLTLSLSQAVDQYRDEYLTARNLAPLTRRAYLGDVSELVTFLAEQLQLTAIGQVERRHLERYLAELDRRGLSGVSRARKVATIRGFFAFLAQQGLLPASPAEKLIPPERERPQPRVLSEPEYKRLLA